ncbi:BAG family molecular chaperone regulator 4 isoform X2 [Heterocephalus glaber]|uniref:BAG family molecular chaperone regulator 4 n=1 Tax=Heterocephalus glaber TaxID=10181 RepID=A0AAX6PP16_HETGA|nr:BAG family molecular chaperone regulator 4 isoform X2 [Heterocephalus glaber]
MSALRRSGYGPSDGPSCGRYYGPRGGDVPVHLPPPMYPPLRPESPQPPISWRVRGGGPETTWPGEGGGGEGYYSSGGAWPEPGRAGGRHQEQPPYPGYIANYWNSAARPRAPYPSTYVVRPELQGQNPGMTMPHYPYGDGNRNVPQSGPTVRPQEDTWASPGACGMGSRYPWPSAVPSAPPGNLYMTESALPWPSSGSPQLPPSPPQQPKDSSYPYSPSDQGMNRHNFACSVHQYDSSGTVNNDHADPLDSQVQYSAEPQLYDNTSTEQPSSQEQNSNLPEEGLSSDKSTPPSIKKIIHVLEKVQYLEQEVEEFVGKKTDKAYWLLEEMLTKELLELDSVETGGQDSVRQARKEAVCKIQAILEKLERKGL